MSNTQAVATGAPAARFTINQLLPGSVIVVFTIAPAAAGDPSAVCCAAPPPLCLLSHSLSVCLLFLAAGLYEVYTHTNICTDLFLKPQRRQALTPLTILNSITTQLTTPGSTLLTLLPSVDPTFTPTAVTACADGSYQTTCPPPTPAPPAPFWTTLVIALVAGGGALGTEISPFYEISRVSCLSVVSNSLSLPTLPACIFLVMYLELYSFLVYHFTLFLNVCVWTFLFTFHDKGFSPTVSPTWFLFFWNSPPVQVWSCSSCSSSVRSLLLKAWKPPCFLKKPLPPTSSLVPPPTRLPLRTTLIKVPSL